MIKTKVRLGKLTATYLMLTFFHKEKYNNTNIRKGRLETIMKLIKLMLVVLAIGFSANSKAVLILETTSCGEWTKPASSLMHHEDMWWLLGYLGGLAAAKDIDFLRDAKPQSLFLWMDKYCKSNPKSNTMEGGDVLADELINKKKK